MSIDGFLFEGRDVTAHQLKREIPAYGVPQLQSALEAGMQSRADVIRFCERRLSTRRASSFAAGRRSLSPMRVAK